MGTICLQTSAAVLPLPQYWDGERSPVTENAAGKQQTSHLFALNLLEFGIFGILFFFPQLDEIYHRVQKLWKWPKRQAGDAIAEARFP